MTLEDKELDSKYMPDNTLVYRSKDVEKAVLDFKEFLDKLDLSYMHERGLTINVIQEEFEKEFGKFEK